MLISLLNCCSRALRHATLTPKHLSVPYRSAAVIKAKNTRSEFGILEELAAKVVRGAAEKVNVASPILQVPMSFEQHVGNNTHTHVILPEWICRTFDIFIVIGPYVYSICRLGLWYVMAITLILPLVHTNVHAEPVW